MTANRSAFFVCASLWALSFLIVLPTSPLSSLAGVWTAIMVWGLVFTGATGMHLPRHALAGLIAVSATIAVLSLMALKWAPDQAAILLVAGGVMWFGAATNDKRWTIALLFGMLVGAVLNVPISVLQVMVPDHGLPGVATALPHGRAGGHLGQPNLLATLALLGLLAAMALRERWGHGRTWQLIAVSLGLCISFTQSRTGLLALVLLLLWVALDKGLGREMRWLPVLALVGCVMGYAWLAVGAQREGSPLLGWARVHSSGDVSASRFAIWSEGAQLLRSHWFAGVGWGQYGAAWSLTPFPGRRPIPLGHAHNLPLHFAVELGAPLALFVLGILGWSLWRARGALTEGPPEQRRLARCLAMMLAVLGTHSLLEYPLWYAYFLLPACYFLGVLLRLAAACLQNGTAHDNTAGVSSAATVAVLKTLGTVIVLAGLAAAWDYTRVLQAFRPFGPGLRKPLEQRVAEGQKSILFGHLVDYGLVTSASSFGELRTAFERPRHRLVNAQFLRAYAEALHEWGEHDKARYVAQRLREFHDPRFTAFFAPCANLGDVAQKPFQCEPPPSGISYDNFR